MPIASSLLKKPRLVEKFMTKSGQTIFKPALAKDIFSKEDFIK